MGRAFILAVLMSCAICRAVSLSPGETLTATFTSVTNTSDILFFSDFYDNLSSTGNPVFTTQLFDGPTLLATVVSPPFEDVAISTYQAMFVSPSSNYLGIPGTPYAVTDLTSMQNGTINGLIKVSISGGSISGLNLADIYFSDGLSTTQWTYYPEDDLRNQSITIQTAVSPEPLSLSLIALGLVYLAAVFFRGSRLRHEKHVC